MKHNFAIKRIFILMVICLVVGSPTFAVPATSSVMNSVFRISGLSKKGRPVTGTCFFVQSSPDKNRQTWLVTAGHVLAMIHGDNAEIVMRKRVANGVIEIPVSIKIRIASKNLYIVHNRFDIAVLKLNMPVNEELLQIVKLNLWS